MPDVPIPWPTEARPGKRPGEGQGDLINAYAVKIGEEVEIRRTPGLAHLHKVQDDPLVPRGMFATGDRLYYLYGGTLRFRDILDNDGVISGLVGGSGPAHFAINIRQDGPQLVLVADGEAYEVNEATRQLQSYEDDTLPFVTDVDYFSGYFIFVSPTNQIIASKLQNTELLAGSEGYSEYASDPLYRVRANNSSLLAFGSRTIEVYADAGTYPYPLARQSVIDCGLIAPDAMAGGSSTWGNGILWVAHDYTVRMLDGMAPKVVSSDSVAEDIFQYRGKVDQFRACVYDFAQQAVFSLSTPDWTWEFNIATQVWHRRDSYGIPSWRGRFATNWNNRWYVQDIKRAGVLQVMVNRYEEGYQDDAERLRYRVESAPAKDFPRAVRIPQLNIDMTNALGQTSAPSPYGTNPAVMVSWSKDGGAVWSRPVARSLGRVGRYAQKVTVNGLGRSTSQGFRIRLDVIDPVPAVLRSAITRNAQLSRARQVEH